MKAGHPEVSGKSAVRTIIAEDLLESKYESVFGSYRESINNNRFRFSSLDRGYYICTGRRRMNNEVTCY